jgi:GntR family transcriptional repressor for pyruvate dehydrogenase complex
MRSIRGSANALRPVERTRLYEDLIDRLRQYARESGMEPGDRFPAERELAQRLGVSRASIHQAMVALEAQGAVEVRHGGGIFLRRASSLGEPLHKLLGRRRRLPEVLEAREALEVKLVELAARRRIPSDLEAMRAALEAMRADVEAGGMGVEGDAAFHRAIASAARSAVLERLLDDIAEPVAVTRIASLSEPAGPAASLAAHRRILAAIESRDAQRAAAAMRDHLEVVADPPA